MGTQSAEAPGEVRVLVGSWEDYRALAAWHYLAGRPATVDLVLRAELGDGTRAGVLVVSRPVLAGWWRERAWPGAYRAATAGERSQVARRLNAEVRTISRVIVDPRFRALGVATALVRAYLGSPRTPRTEAVAAVGGLCPFFARAGMREHRAGPDEEARRLARDLRGLGVERGDLVRADRAERLLARRLRGGGTLGGLLRAWCAGHAATRPFAAGPNAMVAAAVAARLGPRRGAARVAYTWPAGAPGQQGV